MASIIRHHMNQKALQIARNMGYGRLTQTSAATLARNLNVSVDVIEMARELARDLPAESAAQRSARIMR
jgi:Zn-dependent peptidase ImmA (M78 family)